MPPKSVFWRFFEKSVDGKHKCKLRSKKLKTCGNTSNLICHIKSIHKGIFEGIGEPKTISQTRITNVPNENETLLPFGDKTQDVGDDDDCSTASVQSQQSSEISLSSFEQIKPTSSKSIAYRGTSTNSSDAIPQYKKQKTIIESVNTIVSYKEGGTKNLKITNAILYMICRDYQPVSIVENKGFQNLIRQLTSGNYKMPSRKTINSLIDKKYDAVSSLFRKKISQANNYSLTTDIWTETMQSKSFLGTTIHFVEDYELESASLGVVELSNRHTAEYIQEQLLLTMKSWSIEVGNLACIVTDGAKNITKAAETIFEKKKHLHCFAHQINLVAERAIDSCPALTDIIKKQKDIITWFKQSVNASDELRKAQDPRNIKKLIQHVPTRWNSVYFSIIRFLEMREIVNKIVNRHPTAPDMISAREAQELNEVQLLLQPLEAATSQICGENYPTSSIVIPMIYNLQGKIEQTLPEHEVGVQLKESLLNECAKRFRAAEQVYILSISTLLDPRFKKLYFKSPLNCAKAVNAVQDEIQMQAQSQAADSPDPDCTSRSIEKEPAFSETFDFWGSHEKLVLEHRLATATTSRSNLSEMSLYLTCPVIPLKENPLVWWKRNASTYPSLFQIAQKFLSIVATSVPSERLFSKAGQTVTQQRNRMNGKLLSKLLFLQGMDKRYWDL